MLIPHGPYTSHINRQGLTSRNLGSCACWESPGCDHLALLKGCQKAIGVVVAAEILHVMGIDPA